MFYIYKDQFKSIFSLFAETYIAVEGHGRLENLGRPTKEYHLDGGVKYLGCGVTFYDLVKKLVTNCCCYSHLHTFQCWHKLFQLCNRVLEMVYSIEL